VEKENKKGSYGGQYQAYTATTAFDQKPVQSIKEKRSDSEWGIRSYESGGRPPSQMLSQNR